MPADYNHRTDYSHWDAGLRTRVLAASAVLNPFTGEPFSEAALAGLGGGIGFMVFTFDGKETTTASVVTRFHPGPYTENLLRRSGANIHIQQTGSAALAQSRLDAALETGVPVVVRVVHGTLPWIPADPLADMDSVDVAVVARDGEDYFVDDGDGRLERISAHSLAAARTSRKADKHWQGHVVGGGGEALTAEVLTAEVLRRTMAETAQELLSQQAPPGVPAGYAKNFGILGMQSWAQRLRDTSTRYGWARIFGDPQRAVEGLGMLHGVLAGKRFSGPGALRPLYAQFLREVAKYGQGSTGVGLSAMDLEGLAEAAAHYELLGKQWEDLAALIGAAGEPDFALMAEHVEAIAALETTAALALQSASGRVL
ncbi:BtrH N-terminal domain-containing protein [Arthrobacter sp. H35-D1]|uniref:BtrH N-terminal domain-containing protein n=1 Tax=Arthrobacter sp. H35-D1 TaxID=3046202 RepID=UPI0024BAFF5B|nr:BtrH N-terminal domain-containing protein [Arthrobacter sp. H35-D1]MDJ0315298.1 BtrH N-terminal domain-containing protein [Arthrobacter sp. H35-D1]